MPHVQRQPGQDRGVVAVADERLRRCAKIRRFEQRQQLHAAVAAAHGDQRGDGRIASTRRSKAAALQVGGAGQVALSPSKTLSSKHRLEPERPQLGDAGVESLARERAGGATTAMRSPGRSAGACAYVHANLAISAATA